MDFSAKLENLQAKVNESWRPQTLRPHDGWGVQGGFTHHCSGSYVVIINRGQTAGRAIT